MFGRATVTLGIDPHFLLNALEVFRLHGTLMIYVYYSAPQCSHCKRCTSYSISARLSVRLSDRPSVCHTPVLCQNEGT